jgi:hypothetical protein
MDSNSGPNWDDIYALEEFQATLNADTAAQSTAATGVLTTKSTAEGGGLLPTFDRFMAGNLSAPIGEGIHDIPMMHHMSGVVPPPSIAPGIHNIPIVGSNSPGMPVMSQVHNAPIGHSTLLGHNVHASQVHNVPISTGSSEAPEELMDFIITRNDDDEPGADVMQSGQPGLCALFIKLI